MSVARPDAFQLAISRRFVFRVTRDGWTLVSASITCTLAPSIRPA